MNFKCLKPSQQEVLLKTSHNCVHKESSSVSKCFLCPFSWQAESIALLLPQQPGSKGAEDVRKNYLLLGINAASLESLELQRFEPGQNLSMEMYQGQHRYFQGVSPGTERGLGSWVQCSNKACDDKQTLVVCQRET